MVTPKDMRVGHLRSLHLIDDHIGLFAGPGWPLVGQDWPVKA